MRRRARELVVLPPPAAQQQDGVVWEGWGTSLAWWANCTGHDAEQRAALGRLLFARDDGSLGLNIVRYNIGGAHLAHAAEYRPGGAVPCCLRPDGSYDFEADAGQVATLLDAVQRAGADAVCEAFANSPPWHQTRSGSSRGHKLTLRNNLPKDKVGAFAAFCADVVAHFEAAHGIHFRSLSPFNEPSSPAWCLALNCAQEGCYFSKRRVHQVLRSLMQQPALQRTQLVAFEEFCVRDTLSGLASTPKDLRVLPRINMHTYTSLHFFERPFPLLPLWQDNRLWRSWLRRRLQRWGSSAPALWVSEFGTGRGPLALARQIIADLAQLRPSAWVFWQAVEDIGSPWGLLQVLLRHPPAAVEAAAAAGRSVAPAAAQPESAGQPGAGAAQQQGEGVIVQPGFFVLRFIARSLPVGARLLPARKSALRDRGVIVQHAPQHWTLLALNAGGAPWRLALDAGAGARVHATLLDVAALREVVVRAGEGAPLQAEREVSVPPAAAAETGAQHARSLAVPPGCVVRCEVRGAAAPGDGD